MGSKGSKPQSAIEEEMDEGQEDEQEPNNFNQENSQVPGEYIDEEGEEEHEEDFISEPSHVKRIRSRSE